MSRIALAAVMSLLATGCASISHVQTADTLGQGNFQFALEPGAMGVASLADQDAKPIPHVDLAMRYGVTDRLDLGVRVGSSMVELQGKVLLTAPDDPDMAVSLAPSVMSMLLRLAGLDDLTYTNLALPVLVGFKMDGGSELVLGPRVTLTRFTTSAEDGSANIISAGGSLGYALRVAEGLRVMPEVGILFPLVGVADTSSTGSTVSAGFNGGFVQFKLGLLFGAGRPFKQIQEESESSGESVAPAGPALY
ncbi:MAG: hypothetical protein JXB05_04320 [Myxococcaceae bacterium]|nr:hypothetical protein [Myxococcaceae bacterium]